MELKKLESELLELCLEIEKLPASEQQTNVVLKASALHQQVRAERHPPEYDPAMLQPHEQRVIDEKSQLDEKIARLADFSTNSERYRLLPAEEQCRLRQQLVMMELYSDLLGQRIAAF